MNLTERQQWALTIALELENNGWIGAANYLRVRHFPELPWYQEDRTCTHAGWVKLFRIHHGSLPPFEIKP